MTPTVKDVAVAANVSPSTVSKVLNRRYDVTPETVRIVEDALRRVGYERTATRRGRPRVTAGDAGEKTKPAPVAAAIALLFPVKNEESLKSTLTAQLVDGVEAVTREQSIHLHLARLSDTRRLPPCLDPVQVDGLIVRSPVGSQELGLPAIPTVWMFKPGYASITGDRVQPDNEAIGAMAAHSLLSHGYKHLAVLVTRPDHAEAQARAEQFVRTTTGAGAKTFFAATPDIETFANQLLAQSPRPTGLFLPLGDPFLERLYQILQQRGVRCGGHGSELEIISCNNDATHLRLLNPTLANIDICAEEISRAAVDLLLWRLQNPEEHRRCILIPPRLVEPGNSG